MGNMVYQAIANAMSDISPIAKGQRNQQQGFQYRGIDDVMNELSPILAKHRLFIYPEVINAERSERQTAKGSALIYSILTIKYHFATEDGSEVCVTVIGEGMDSGDKASNKAMAVAFKYACLQMFCIPTDDMPDPDKGTPPGSKPMPPNQPPPKQGNPPHNPSAPPPPPPKKPTERQNAINQIVGMMQTLDADGNPVFTAEEKENEKRFIEGTKGGSNYGVDKLKIELIDLQKELDRRLHFFEDDIPQEQEPEQPDIF
jgi:hypothetical protein